MVYSLATMRTYVRSLDARLGNVTQFTDAWIDNRIEEGLAIAQNTKPVFSTTETYDLTSNITVDLLTQVEIILQREVHSVHDVTYDTTCFTAVVTPNNHVILTVIPNHPVFTDFSVKVRYYFFPTFPLTQLEMSMEIWTLVREGIAINAFSWLSDEVNENKHRSLINGISVMGAFDTEKDMLDTPTDRFWARSWA